MEIKKIVPYRSISGEGSSLSLELAFLQTYGTTFLIINFCYLNGGGTKLLMFMEARNMVVIIRKLWRILKQSRKGQFFN
ncbi:hypothetical protein LI82_00185 [Methanococcoides methylutens]|uniref:Uncharacterized protein n=1 Tax=Methanococcoides methylutens TaxID=2226 RepID=A0A099T3P5_METMT|nr:hypothetical protein LI82_00185 [Methanococcoides methylutens]